MAEGFGDGQLAQEAADRQRRTAARQWRACTGTQPGAASTLAPTAIISISQNTMCSLRSLRARMRPVTADTA